MTINSLITRDRFIGNGCYGDVYKIDDKKVVKLFKRRQMWSKCDIINLDDCNLIVHAHQSIDYWMLYQARKWDKKYFPEAYGIFSNENLEDELQRQYISGHSLIIEYLHGEELTYNEMYKTVYRSLVEGIVDVLEEISKPLWHYGRISPHDCAFFVDEMKNIKLTDLGGWNDQRYLEFFAEHGCLSMALREELYTLIKQLRLPSTVF